ncbi:hypothetical protein ACWEN3_33240 [Streptomyces sp. NPDC004561]
MPAGHGGGQCQNGLDLRDLKVHIGGPSPPDEASHRRQRVDGSLGVLLVTGHETVPLTLITQALQRTTPGPEAPVGLPRMRWCASAAALSTWLVVTTIVAVVGLVSIPGDAQLAELEAYSS